MEFQHAVLRSFSLILKRKWSCGSHNLFMCQCMCSLIKSLKYLFFNYLCPAFLWVDEFDTMSISTMSVDALLVILSLSFLFLFSSQGTLWKACLSFIVGWTDKQMCNGVQNRRLPTMMYFSLLKGCGKISFPYSYIFSSSLYIMRGDWWTQQQGKKKNNYHQPQSSRF